MKNNNEFLYTIVKYLKDLEKNHEINYKINHKYAKFIGFIENDNNTYVYLDVYFNDVYIALLKRNGIYDGYDIFNDIILHEKKVDILEDIKNTIELYLIEGKNIKDNIQLDISKDIAKKLAGLITVNLEYFEEDDYNDMSHVLQLLKDNGITI